MKNLPNNHTPKEDSWDKILGKMDFESQVEGHIPNLPMFEPEAKSWASISERLGEQKKVVWWPYASIAAALIGVILVASIVWNEGGSLPNPNLEKHALTEIGIIELNVEVPNPPTSALETQTKPTRQIAKKEPGNTNPKAVPLVALEIPELDLIAMETALIVPDTSRNSIDPTADLDPKTRHEVTISWRLKPSKFQVKTAFGKQDPSKSITEQTGSISQSRKFRIGQKN